MIIPLASVCRGKMIGKIVLSTLQIKSILFLAVCFSTKPTPNKCSTPLQSMQVLRELSVLLRRPFLCTCNVIRCETTRVYSVSVLSHLQNWSNPLCASYNFSEAGGRGDWSTRGGYVISVDMEEETVVCGCSHLTNFGLLVVGGPQLFTGQESQNIRALPQKHSGKINAS